MLTTLYIENIAVIEKTSIDFSQGLNVLTGETGAGKSIIIDSINAIMGQRTSKELVRTGAKTALVTAQFDDVNENDWYYTSVMSCAENAVTVGISQTTFGVGQNITRQDAATMLSRVMSMTQKRTNSDTFADDNLIADYAKDSVYAMKDHGILSGYEDNTFRPVSLLSRAEAAKIIYEAIQLGGE